ncbi:alpha-galactosidase [Sphaerisporangium album]|uniref:Alpha-galactosidase n=1 Tax=Sphaerisporangium album TaxID=509200 RepID=A0A367FJK9_9ACTN|nr:glycoside hydrolase family 36 protein [Sphaerisporangium album]RCG29897.1 alpha-galactosidase [Sphaerisporangium album]
MIFHPIADVPVDPVRGLVHAHGWQSWTPTTTLPVTGRGFRPVLPIMQTMRYRPGLPAPGDGFQGEGLLAVAPGPDGPVRLFTARDGLAAVPSIRARLVGDRLTVTADEPDEVVEKSFPGPLDAALAAFADGLRAGAGVGPPRTPPTVWCSWYHYYENVTEDDVLENLREIGAHDLPVDVVQIDDGWQAAIGDWLTPSGRFSSMPRLAARVHAEGRRAGLWVAPFVVGARSALARAHPEWLVGDAGHNWDQDLYGLDVTHPGAAAYLREVFQTLCGWGFDYFKLDFLYASAVAGRRHSGASPIAAYREGLALVREAVGPGPYMLGSGAPILPSVGLVEAMRVAPDIAPHYDAGTGDLSDPAQRAAALTTTGRSWQHGRLWVNDPDCLLARPAVQHREDWSLVVERYGGLRASSDRIADLDGWGLDTTRRLLSTVPPPTPFPLVTP